MDSKERKQRAIQEARLLTVAQLRRNLCYMLANANAFHAWGIEAFEQVLKERIGQAHKQ